MSRRQGIIRWWYWLHFSTLVVILPTIAAATRLSRDVDLGASKDSQGPTSKVRTIVVDLATATRKVRKERTEHLVEEHHLHPSDRGVREWIVLKKLFDAVEGTEEMQTEGHWLDENYNLCMWRGITCGPDKSDLIEMEKGGVTVPADAITKIVLVHEELQGTLPTELGMLEFLTRLELQYNELHGSIPDNYSYIPRLRLIDLSHNELSGSIPETLGTHSTRLEGIHIADNHLIGQIPPNLVAWSNLRHFDVSNNVLTGTIPDALFELKNLKYLVAADNWISGELPSRIANLSSLRLLDLGSMLLCGPLPSNINQLKSLQDLNLGDNRFTGALPSEIWDLSELQTFLASNNQFTGTLPTSAKEVGWHKLTNLGVLRLDNNRLTGSIPRDLFVGLKASLQWLDLSYNRLSGTIATEIGQMIRLRTIDVMANMISGSLPDEMLEMNMNLRLNFTNNLCNLYEYALW
jgi:Leucine-rich repeat (LRR) protein